MASLWPPNKILYSISYFRYIEGLNAENRTITEWERTFTATPENTSVPDESRLPTHWLANGAGSHGTVTDALWALRDLMLKDALSLQRTLPFEALCKLQGRCRAIYLKLMMKFRLLTKAPAVFFDQKTFTYNS